MRVRGLKLIRIVRVKPLHKSHPMRVRGLKLAVKNNLLTLSSRTPCGCVD